MLIVERPALYPGVGLRGMHSPRGMVDTQCDMVSGGRVYLEEQTVHEAAHLFGYTSPKDTAKLVARISELETELASATERLEAYGELSEAVRKSQRVTA